VATLVLGGIGTAAAQSYDPVAFRLCAADGPDGLAKCAVLGDPPARTVPSGRRLIIEQVSGECGGDVIVQAIPQSADILAQTGGTVVPHSILLVTFPTVPGGVVQLTSTRIYADPGSQVTIGLAGVSGDSFCRLSFSGQLVRP
jgi:hypothetical protein